MTAELPRRKDIAVSNADLESKLSRAIDTLQMRDRELSAFMKSAKAILMHQGFAETARAIFDYCRELTGASSGYVALLSEDGSENEVLFLEAGGMPCSVDPELPMPIRGLRAIAYRDHRAVFENDFMNSRWIAFMPGGHVTLKNVMFAPLVLDGKAVGLIGLANKATDFTDEDARIAAAFGELAAVALQNSKYLDARDRAETEREKVIAELEQALARVKQLSGLLPICASCKKIRDDRGYWRQIESYVRDHSEAEFSHGVCPDCTRQLYAELDLDESA